ncbi:universal stress protein [Ktedonosporobacter rubrisoli]|nr:universal stress protein [Ktedonosporobacter rubrisoli]
MFKRILVPLDGSKRAECAVPIAARLARAFGGTIFLVRVVNTVPSSLPSAPARPMLIQTVSNVDRELAESYLQGIASSGLLAGISLQTVVPFGLVPASILTTAADKHADIIVMCSHGYTGITRWWMIGSVAAKVAPFAEIPVLVLHEGGPLPQERQAGGKPLRVLVPLDGSDYASAALAPAAYLAAALAAPAQGELHLTHVVQPASPLLHRGRDLQYAQASRNMARAYLDTLMRQMHEGADGADIAALNLQLSSSVAIDEDIAQGVVRVAEHGRNGEGAEVAGGCDLIAMTAQGHSGPQRWMGSVTERVLHTSRLPLFIIRASREQVNTYAWSSADAGKSAGLPG